MIKLLPITRCTQCRFIRHATYGQHLHKCAKCAGLIKNINEIPEWCPLDDAEVENVHKD